MSPLPHTPSRLIISCFALMVTAYGMPTATAGPEPRTHDGFFLRMSTGPGYASAKFDFSNGDELELHGAGGSFRLDIGGRIGAGTLLYGTLGTVSVGDPEVKSGDVQFTLGGADATVTDIGIGLSHYFTPSNFFIGGAFGFYGDDVTAGNTKLESDTGVGLMLTAGKEWWISNNWALGASLFLSGSRINSSADDGTIRNGIAGVSFSATYN